MNRGLYPSQSMGNGIVYAPFRMTLAGAATTVTVSLGKELIKSVTHVGGTNVWTITLFDGVPNVVYAFAEPRDDAANGQYVTTGTIANEASTTQQPITFKIATFNANGGVQNDSTLVVGGEVCMLNTNLTSGN